MKQAIHNQANFDKSCASACASKLLKIPVAAKQFGMSASTFLRFRNRHNIRTLPGHQLHVDDIMTALELERGVDVTTKTQRTVASSFYRQQ